MTVLLVHGDREYLVDPGDRLETDLGVLEVPEDVGPGDRLETHLGEPFRVRALRAPDLFRHLERTGAPMMPRDVGLVVGLTGIEAGDRVLDAGTGTGVLAAHLGRIGADVLTFERDPDFAEVARENMALAGVGDRVEVRTGDVLDVLAGAGGDGSGGSGGEDPGPFDVVTLDTEDAPAVVECAPDLLVQDGYVAAYCPFVESARAVERAATDAGLSSVRTLETIQREMEFGERGSRPSTAGVGHTGFLTIGRLEGST